ncbi:MAG: ABC transporter permease [Candidatus Niyogibacteria bacterium]|nr:ABC transporter permease [Candidatus Niyogibacteria bacterium]
MRLKNSIQTSFAGLKTNRSRSALTILGIVIGITAIILVVSVGQGAQDLILNQIQALGSKTIVVLPGREPSGPTDPSVIDSLFSDSLKEREMKALENKSNAPFVKNIMPIVFGAESGIYEGETFRLTMIGTSELAAEIFDLSPEEGGFFTADDIRGRTDVAVIGSKVKEELFGQSQALGERIKIKGRNFRVIGILPTKGQVSFFNFDETVLVPYTTAQTYVFGIKHFNRLVVEAESEEFINQTVKDIEITLRNLHNITDESKDDFFIETQADIAERVSTVTNILTLFLATIAAISLLVGGIGIMNIMLVSVTERTREIGLRKAVGATSKNILLQFLLEAVFLTATGGVIGIALGSALSFAVSVVLSRFIGLNWTFSFPFFAAFLGFLVSSLVGLAFGIYPARQASLKSPIEALRYE